MGTAPDWLKKSQQIKWRWRRRRDSNPRYRIYQYDGLANRWFQPLTHVSGLQRRAGSLDFEPNAVNARDGHEAMKETFSVSERALAGQRLALP